MNYKKMSVLDNLFFLHISYLQISYEVLYSGLDFSLTNQQKKIIKTCYEEWAGILQTDPAVILKSSHKETNIAWLNLTIFLLFYWKNV